MFVHERFKDDTTLQRHAGWWGHNKETRFDMDGEFDPLSGAEGWQLSNPPVFQVRTIPSSSSLCLPSTNEPPCFSAPPC